MTSPLRTCGQGYYACSSYNPLGIYKAISYKKLETCAKTITDAPVKYEYPKWLKCKSSVEFCSEACFKNWYAYHAVLCAECGADICNDDPGGDRVLTTGIFICKDGPCAANFTLKHQCVVCKTIHKDASYIEKVDGVVICRPLSRENSRLNCKEIHTGIFVCTHCQKVWNLAEDPKPKFLPVKYSNTTQYMCDEPCEEQIIRTHTCTICKYIRNGYGLRISENEELICKDSHDHPTCWERHKGEYFCNMCNTVCRLADNPHNGFEPDTDILDEYEIEYDDDETYFNVCNTCLTKYIDKDNRYHWDRNYRQIFTKCIALQHRADTKKFICNGCQTICPVGQLHMYGSNRNLCDACKDKRAESPLSDGSDVFPLTHLLLEEAAQQEK